MPRGVYKRKRKPGRPSRKERLFVDLHTGRIYPEDQLCELNEDGAVVFEVIGRYIVRTKASLEKTKLTD